MDALSTQKIRQNSDRTLELVFFAPPIPNQWEEIEIDHQFNQNGIEKSSSALQLKTKIDTQLIDYKIHYIKDIESNFPDVELTNLIVSPKMIDEDWRIEKAESWKIQNLNYPHTVQNWFPVFYNRTNSRQYFQSQLQLIAVILQTDNQYEGFIGYVPAEIRVFDIVYLLSLFFGTPLTNKTLYLTHLSGLNGNVLDLKKRKVKELAGNYLKIYSFSHTNQQQSHKIEIKQRDLLDQFLDDQPSQKQASIIHYNMQSLETNHAATQILWEQDLDNDAETCFEPSNEVRKKLIALKSEQEIQKIRNRAKMITRNPIIQIPHETEQQMQSKLNGLSFQLQKYLKC